MGNNVSSSLSGKTGRKNTYYNSLIEASIDSIEFVNSHDNMRKNDIVEGRRPKQFRIDWRYSGDLYSQPEWRRGGPEQGQNAPVSCSRSQKLRLSLGLTVERMGNVPPSLQGQIVGRPVESSNRSFRFTSKRFELREASGPVLVVGKSPLPDWPTQLEERIQWTFQGKGGTRGLGQSGPHTVFVTFGLPIARREKEKETGSYVYEATLARMREATRRVEKIGPCPSVKLIEALFKKFDNYVLGRQNLPEEKQREVTHDPDLWRYMNEVDWPTFFSYLCLEHLEKNPKDFGINCLEPIAEVDEDRACTTERETTEEKIRGMEITRTWMSTLKTKVAVKRAFEAQDEEDVKRFQAGPWPLAVLERYGGECQAIVRFVLAVLRQVGFPGESRPGSVEKWYATARVEGNTWKPVIEPTPPVGREPGDKQYALVDDSVRTGIYSWEEINQKHRLNNFEAFLRYRYKKNGTFYQAWYGGGVGRVGEPQKEQTRDEPLTIAFERKLLRASFAGIVEYENMEDGRVDVTNYWSFQ